jgi:urease accessory protein UreF
MTGVSMRVVLADEINAAHDRVAQCLSEGLSHATRAGELLLRAKADVGHGGWLKWLKQNVSFSTRTAQLYMQLAKLAPDAQRVAHLPLRRTVLELQRLDREARRQADRQGQEEARWDQHSETRVVHTQLDQHRLKADPIGSVVLEIVHAQLDALERTVADELIEALLFNAVEAGVSIRSLIDAWGRRFGPGTRREWARDQVGARLH